MFAALSVSWGGGVCPGRDICVGLCSTSSRTRSSVVVVAAKSWHTPLYPISTL